MCEFLTLEFENFQVQIKITIEVLHNELCLHLNVLYNDLIDVSIYVINF